MPEETVVAATSAEQETPATPAPEFDSSRGALVDLSPEQRSEYKKTGVLPKAPEPKKTEEVAPPQSEPKGESAADAGPAKGKQEHTDKQPKKPTAEERIAQLESTIEKIRKGAGIERKAEPAAAPEPKAENQAQQPPRNYQEWRKLFKPTAWVEQYGKDNPDASYEDAQAAMNDFQDEVRSQFRQAEERQKAMTAQMSQKLADAEKRYGAKFDEVLVPTLKAVNEKIVPAIRQLMEESDVLPHVLFTMGNEEGGVEKFLSLPPGKQARWFALAEALVEEQLTGKSEETKPEPPAKPQTKAPPPPADIGGRASTPEDALVSAAKANDYRRFSAESTRQALARMK